jgi:hypothetical protein
MYKKTGVSDNGIDIIEEYEQEFTIPDGTWSITQFETSANYYFDSRRNVFSYIQMIISQGTGKTTFRFKTGHEMATWNSIYGLKRKEDYRNTTKSSWVDSLEAADFDMNVGDLDALRYNIDLNPYNSNINKSLAWKLGFRNNTKFSNISSINTINQWGIDYMGVLESNSFYGESLNDYIYIIVDDFHNNYNDGIICSLQKTYMSALILARVQFRSSPLSINYDNSPSFKTRIYNSPIKIDKLRIKLIDKYGDPILLGKTTDYSMVFTFTQNSGII